jgi:protein-L-isoaspartate(D-aspartate) O-methyltransferase
MTDYTGARKNMVECQLHPCGISEQRVLDAYNNIPRERFVSQAQRSIAYADHDLPLGHERFLMAPMTHAKLVHAANVGADDVVLDIGGATGYSAAILSQLATTVVAVENQPDFVEHAKAALLDLDLLNILHFDTPLLIFPMLCLHSLMLVAAFVTFTVNLQTMSAARP